MIKGYEYQSDFARKYYAQGREKGCEQGLRRAIVELVGARLPGLRDELEHRLRDEPQARLVQLAGELGRASGEDEARAILGRHQASGPHDPPGRARGVAHSEPGAASGARQDLESLPPSFENGLFVKPETPQPDGGSSRRGPRSSRRGPRSPRSSRRGPRSPRRGPRSSRA